MVSNQLVAGQLMPLDPDWELVAGEFIYIPAGEFMMGSEMYGQEMPVHKVIISRSFEMSKYLVTQEQWQIIMSSNPSCFKGDKLPVESVSWLDVQEFIIKLNAKSSKYLYSLPTEAQWEYVCRAGNTGDYAESVDNMAWYGNNSGGKTHPVGQKQPNSWGLYDMYGNVLEWCFDWYDDYSGSTVTDPSGVSLSWGRVFRGGGFNTLATTCRPGLRGGLAPDSNRYYVGFRLVRIVK